MTRYQLALQLAHLVTGAPNGVFHSALTGDASFALSLAKSPKAGRKARVVETMSRWFNDADNIRWRAKINQEAS